jgi:hypothetical protein
MKRSLKFWTFALTTLLAIPAFGSAAANAAAPTRASLQPKLVAPAVFAAARCCHWSIPSTYEYHPNSGPHVTLHDYCTSSPDSFPAPGTNADFRGPCARHDMCYGGTRSKLSCDNQLGTQLAQECTYTYAWYDPRRGACVDTAHVYWLAVVLHTIF